MSHKDIVHRDLKPDNILLSSKEKDQYDIRVADFGFACLINIPTCFGEFPSILPSADGILLSGDPDLSRRCLRE